MPVPRPGDQAPNFTATCVTAKGSSEPECKPVSLKDFKGKWVILFFYPMDFTFVCPTEIIAFSEASQEFENRNTKVFGISVDSEFTHIAWIQTAKNKGGLGRDLKVPLLSDISRKMSNDYDVLMPEGFTMRALFLIDPEGVVRHVTLQDPPVGRNVDEVLRVLDGFQHVGEHNEVCPMNWRKGDATIKPDPSKKMEYFEKKYATAS